ncbi:MAG TPA: carboxypeptidase-like regulatory domain-containing protein [Phaeodactylibacter sp.]|nr:carboxypeptidase-like regulatory domain-containing protein [Phaeodactylibacter sp.]
MKSIYLLFFFLLNSIFTFSQVKGKITDSKGEPLPFASIYVQGTSNGTTSNIEGDYVLELKKGTYKLVFQFIGYEQKVKTLVVDNQPVTLDVVLSEEAFELAGVVVTADAEDPAYAIIRKAIQKRKYYKNQVSSYQCNVYIKGGIKLLDAPTNLLGNDLGDMGGQLDSNRQGVIYLSESEAILNFKQPDHYKEIMTSSKVSGDDNGFSFNRASEMDFNFYKNTSMFQREMVSPIARNAMTYYRYKLLGTFFDENGRMINKIQVIQKRKEDPTYGGVIYIVDKLWNIQATELYLTQQSLKLPGMDSLWLKQVHVPVQEPDVWRLFSQTITFKAGFLGFKMKGVFTGVYKNYNLNPSFDDKYFNNEVLIFEEGANEKSLEYWDSIRPIPLTVDESEDYVKKDSLQKIWDSKVYKDSIDKVRNKFKLVDILLGYSYQNSWKKQTFTVKAPISTIQFNPVQGGLLSLDMTYRKGFDERGLRYYFVNPKIQYGFADERWRARVNFFYHLNRTTFSRFYLSGGREVMQFNSENPIGPILSATANLFDKQNYMKLYERDFLYGYYSQEVMNGLVFRLSSEYAKRRALRVNTQYSWKKKNERYDLNEVNPAEGVDLLFKDHSIFYVETSIRIRFAQKYLTYPNRKYIMGSKYPTVHLTYQKAIRINNAFTSFNKITLRILDDNISMGVLGYSEFNIKTGTIFSNQRINLVDYNHFNGNHPQGDSRLFLGNPNKYITSFLRLSYYEKSTKGEFFEGHYQHHFAGFLMDKVPLIRKLGLETAMGVNFLYTKSQKDYAEVYFGIDNLGFKIFRLFRVDVVASFRERKFDDWGIVVGMKL